MTGPPSRHCPVSDPQSAEYWAGCRRHELLLQRCAACGRVQFYPRSLCTGCGGVALDWLRATGRGAVSSFSIVRRAVSAAYAAEVPYVLALIRLAEGPTLMSTVGGCALEDVRIGMAVDVAFDDWPEGVTVPRFVPAAAG